MRIKLIAGICFLALAATNASAAANSRCKAGAIFTDEIVDCGGAEVGFSCNADDEGQPPVITLRNATVKNLKISRLGASDGIHCESGNCVAQNVVWAEVCEDAASIIKDNASLTIIGGSALNTISTDKAIGGKPDKFFQINNKNTKLTIKGGFVGTIDKGDGSASTAGKLARSCGDCTVNSGPRTIVIDDVLLKGPIGSVVSVNREYAQFPGNFDTATITRLRIQGWVPPTSSKPSKPKVCIEWKGVNKKTVPTVEYGEKWGTNFCKVSVSNVTSVQ